MKHSASDIDELIEIKAQLSEKVLATETIDEAIFEKENTLQALELSLNDLAEDLHKKRNKAIPELSSQLETILVDLGMANAKFKISVLKEGSFYNNGKDKISFLFTANKGGEFKPLKKAASGGELSRIMLAVNLFCQNIFNCHPLCSMKLIQVFLEKFLIKWLVLCNK